MYTQVYSLQQFVITKYWKQPDCPDIGEWLSKLGHSHSVEYYADTEKNERLGLVTDKE